MHSLITIDYEIFGDGSGDLISTVVEPMNRIMKICNRYGVKVNIFFEVAEYQAMKIASKQNPNLAKKLTIMESQIRKLKEEGHNIQLHIHPQFLKYQYDGFRFHVDNSSYTFDQYLNGKNKREAEYILKKVLREGILSIKDILKDDSYEVIAFRAGGWNMAPAELIIPILRDLGVIMDSSGVKGAVMKSSKHNYDYRGMVDRIGPWWTTADSIDKVGPKNRYILEMPIYSSYGIPFDPRKLLLIIKGKRLCAKHNSGSSSSSLDLKTIYYTLMSGVRWDFCKLDAKAMWNFFLEGKKMDNLIDLRTMVMIGHNKEYDNDYNFKLFLKKMVATKERLYTLS